MKLILYIGHHKVGSTSLQQFLAVNSIPLAREGVLYPATESDGLSYMLASSLFGAEQFDRTLSINAREPHNSLAFRMLASRVKDNKGRVPPFLTDIPSLQQMRAFLRNQKAYLKPHTMVVCSEVMANFGKADPTLIDELYDILGARPAEIYCALRRPDDYIVSWHGQRLKFGQKIPRLSAGGTQAYFSTVHFDYRLMLAPWVERSPEARLHVRPYEEIVEAGGSVLDFTRTVSVDFSNCRMPRDDSNPSIPSAALEIARRGNGVLAPQGAQVLRQFLIEMRKHKAVPANAEVELFGAAARAALADAFAPIEAYLETLTGRTPFFRDLEALRQERPIPEDEANRAVLRLISPQDPRFSETPGLPEFIAELRREYGL
ncbi:hypothetical protein [Paenirhodobacter hankyongi]|uniref:Sulfotransferase family protein n=1 Tax=Paenirhodobacter hankyongi TaxID=2294033 RepID=A0A421BSN3_9RHOB|nr:hypothetical protein [Sinirhodobacter hankyongi]RLL71299.1 hypothetical protein DYS74_05310 [Sinirhodobacter hankyongi]